MKKPRNKRTKEKRITAFALAVLLALTGSPGSFQESAGRFHPGSIHAYASETETPPGDGEPGVEDFNAALGGIRKYFMKLGNRVFQTVTPGETLPDKTTFVSFDTEDGYYYLVRQSTEPASDPEKPDNASAALDQGWIRKTGTGTYVWQNLSWNRTYDVYELDVSVTPTVMRKLGSAATRMGKTGGNASIEGELLIGTKAAVKVVNPSTEDGTWSWYTAASADAAAWTPCPEGVSGTRGEELTIPSTAGGCYLKALFTPREGGDFEGNIESISGQPAAFRVTGAAITGAAEIGSTLTASVIPGECSSGVRYEWYRTAPESTESTGGQFLYAGSTYTIQAEDIGNRLYVKAVALPVSNASGEAASSLTGVVTSAAYQAPSAPEIKKTGATALTVGMPEGTDPAGLYEFGYSSQADPDKAGAEFHIAAAKARGTGEVIIPELTSSTVYYIWSRRAGENGFTESPWSAAPVAAATLPPALTGALTLTGSCIYGETLTVSMSIPSQNGSFHWYRDGAELTDTGNQSYTEGSSSYRLGTADIGKQLTVICQGEAAGSGSPSSGELTIVSDVIEKKSSAAPVFTLSDGDVGKTDSSLAFTLSSSETRQMKVGYADSATGVPVSRSSTFNPGDRADLTGLDRNTDYYLFLKYTETETEKEGDWSEAAGPFRTEKRSLDGDTIEFNLETPHPGDRLTATLTSNRDLGEIDGTWSWMEVVGGSTTPVAFAEDMESPEQTSYQIPDTAVEGTRYTVTFSGGTGMEGVVTGTSATLTPARAEPYPTPSAPVITAATDTSLTVGMAAGTEGIYQFSYGTDAAAAEAGWTVVENTAYGANTIILSGLVRNTVYYVRAKRLSSEIGYAESEWSVAAGGRTGLTELGGTVDITGEAVNGETLTAAYTSASYLPAGDDTGGTWRWQRALSAVGFVINGEVQDPVYQDIAGAVADTYTLTTADLNCRLKAVYTAPEAKGFTGEKAAETDVVVKTAQTAPPAAVLEAGSESADEIRIRVKSLTAGSWYQIRERSAEAPKAPSLPEDAAGLGWISAAAATEVELKEYYDPTSKTRKTLQPETSYIVYTVYAGTTDSQPSSVTAGTSLTAGYYQQTGTIAYTSGSGAVIVSGKELKAELTGGNNSRGSWKWYVSTKRYSAGTPESGDWTYLPSGYYPISNSTTSTLTLTDDMVGNYVRAEFVSDPSGGYAGTIGETGAGEGYYSQYVRKIYRETLKLESSSTNGFGETMAYAGSRLTGTIENYVESGDLNSNRTKVELLANGVVMTGITMSYSENTFTCILPRNKEKAGQTITARVSKPKDLNLYVTEKLAALEVTELTSDASTGTSLIYKDGIPISTTEEFEALMSAGSVGGQSFADRTEDYVLTENIICSDTVIQIPQTVFNGTVDGDYHTVSNIKNPMFNQVGNTVVQNIIFNVASLDTSGLSAQETNSVAVIAKTSVAGTTVLKRLFLSQATATSVWDASYLIGKTQESGSVIRIEECGSAGGSLRLTTLPGKSAAGIIGFIDSNTTVYVDDVFSYNTKIIGQESNMAGFAVVRGKIILNNVIIASILDGVKKATSGGVLGLYNSSCSVTAANSYYDSTLSPSTMFSGDSRQGTPLETKK